MAALVVGMHPEMKSEMAQEYHREMQNMKEAQQETRTPPWELVALDADGNEVYATEYFESREEAQAEADAFDEGDAYWCDNVPDEVDRFEPRRTDQ